MASRIEEILGQSINGTKALKDAIRELQDQLVTATQGTQEWTDTAEKLNAAQSTLAAVMNAGKQSVDAATDSIAGMEKEYKELYNTYRLLTEEQRNSPFGQEMADQLETMSTKLNETKKGVGNFKDNIGRYADDAVAAFGAMGVSMGGLATPLKLANGGFKALNATIKANPLFWLIAAIQAIIAIFKVLKDAIMSNEESQMALNEAMSAFQPIIDGVKNGLDLVGQVIVKVIGWLADAFRKIREIGGMVTDFLGITDGAADKIKEQNELYEDLAKRTNELTKAKREQQKLNAQDEAELNTLKDKAAAEENEAEKLKLLEKAKAKQEEITARNIKLAEEELALLIAKSKLTANDAATNDKIAAAEAAVAKAKAEGAAKTKELTGQITALTKSRNKGSDAIKREKEELNKLLKTLEENTKTELQKLEEKYKKELALLKKYKKDTTLLEEQYENERNEILLKKEKERVTNFRNVWKQLIEGNEEALLITEQNWANDDLQLAKSAVADAKAEIAELEKAGKASAEKVAEVWAKAGKKMNPEMKLESENDASVALILFEKKFKKASEALTKYLEVTTKLDENAKKITEEEIAALEEKSNVIKSTTLTEEQQALEIKRIDDELLQAKIDNLKLELDTLDLTNEEKLAKWNAYYNALKQQSDAYAATQEENYKKEMDAFNNRIEAAQFITTESATLLDSISSLGDAIGQNIQLQLEDEEVSEEVAKKKKKQLKALQDMQLALTLAVIAADTASGIMNIWKGYAAEKAVNALGATAAGPAAPALMAVLEGKSLGMAILQTASMGVMGAAQMAAAIAGNISNKKSIDGMGGGGAAAAAGTVAGPIQIDTTPYSYTRQIQTEEEEQMLNRPIWVSVTDIENGLNHAKVVDQESSF
jgi:ribosomal protein L25 (general stress protein Ctc)